MAIVRFSNDLKEQIVANARAKFEAQIDAAKKSFPPGWGDKVYDIIFADYLQAMSALPSEFFSTTERITVRMVNAQACQLVFGLSNPRPFPPGALPPGITTARRASTWDASLTLSGSVWDALEQEIMGYQARISFAASKQKMFAEEVKKVIESFSTLAPALKAWPPLWDLVPESYKDKHRAVKEREKRSAELNADLTKLTALAAQSKIIGG